MARVLAGVTLALYILGLLSVNGYLLGLGVSDFSLIRVRFIYTGALIVILTAISALIPLSVAASIPKMMRRSRTVRLRSGSQHRNVTSTVLRWMFYIAGLISGLILVPLLLGMIFSYLEGRKETSNWGPPVDIYPSGALGIFAPLLVICLLGSLETFRDIYRKDIYKTRLSSWTPLEYAAYASAFGGIFVLMAGGLYISFFMTAIYPKVPVQFGGGQPTEVRVLVNHDAVDGAKSMGIPFPATGDVSYPVQLTYEGSDLYVVEVEGGILQLRKEMVSGVVLQPPSIQEPLDYLFPEVRILFKHDAVTGAKSLGVPFPRRGDLSSPLLLVGEGSDEYLIKLPGDTPTVHLKKEMVSGIVPKS
jgi:hypothetical protein